MTVEDFIAEWCSTSSIIVAHTSGSTGKPKDIFLDKAFVLESARRTIKFFGLNSHSRLHLCLSPDYIAGKMMIVRAIEAGCRMTIEEPSNKVLAEDTDLSPIDLLATVPSQLENLLHRPNVLEKVRNIIVGGSAIPHSLVEKCTSANLCVYETYGMTETASHVALRRIGEEWFYPLRGIAFSKDSRGCLVITFTTDGQEFITNDIVDINQDGGMKVLGRIDNVIISGGMKIHPEEVERKIEKLLSPAEYYISSYPDNIWGEAVCLVLERNECLSDIDILQDSLRKLLPPQERPKKICIVDSLPRTESGKIKRITPLSPC